jgi:hypothetical protein
MDRMPKPVLLERESALLHQVGHRLLAHRSDRGEYPDIAIVPIATEAEVA